MTSIEELIAKHCPDGVEFKRVIDIVEINRGKRVTKKELNDDFEYEVYHGSKDTILGRYNHYNVSENTTIIVNTGGIGGVKFLDKKFWCSDGSFYLGHSKEINDKFLYYCLSIYEDYFLSKKRVGAVPTIERSIIEEVKIPLPPLAVQQEIVRILDTFSSLTAELIEKLTAELKLRKKQYEYYRDELLTFGSDVPRVRFGYIATIVRGASPRPISRFITESEDGIHWVKIGDVEPNCKYITQTEEKITPEGAKKSRLLNIGDFVLSNSMSFGRPYIMKIKGCIHDGWLSISNFEKYFNSDFLYHLLSSNMIQDEMKQKVSYGTVKNLKADIVKSIILPLPPLEVQQQIVSVLDKFDTYCNDLTNGLPKEIELRKKQYEYYRDLLLTFRPLTKR